MAVARRARRLSTVGINRNCAARRGIAQLRAAPLKRLRGLATIAVAGRSNGGGACRGRCSVPRWIGEPRRRHCFRRATRKARRVRDPRRRPASRRHSRTQRRRRRRRRRRLPVVVRRFVSFPVYPAVELFRADFFTPPG